MSGATDTANHLLALDWGTSSLRGALLDRSGRVLEERSFARGILSVAPGEFAQVFEACFGDWAHNRAGRCLISGMAGSQQGWREAPYCACPAGFADVAAQLVWIDDPALKLPTAIVPGLCCEQACAVSGLPSLPDVMRGEEVQIFGAMQHTGQCDGLFLLPGTHSKWAQVEGARVTSFRTFMTGEWFALLARHSLLAKSIAPDAPLDEAAFTKGVLVSRRGTGLLHNAFSTRTLSLFGRMDAAELGSYLSGLVIGEELQAQTLPPGTGVVLVGSAALTQRYTQALALFGVRCAVLGTEATWAGIHALAKQLPTTPEPP